MASGSGIVLHTGTYSQLRMDWSSTPNVSTNQSSFTATLYVQVTTPSWNIGPWSDVSGSYFGTSTGHTFNGSIGNISTGRTNLRTFNTTVNHASDGKGSITIHWKWGVNSSWGGVVNPSGSRTFTLDTIARTSKHTLSHSSRAFGDTLTITTNRASSAFTHKLWCQFAGRNLDIATGVGTSYSWAIPKSWASYLSDGTTTPMNVICETYNGSTKIGSHTVGMTITVADTAEFRPKITATSVVEGSSIPSIFSGTFVQGKSSFKMNITAEGAYSSWIKSSEIKANGQTFTSLPATTSALTTSGSNTVNFKVIDSRGRSATATANISVVAYADPSPSALTAVRCNSAGVEDDEGTYAKITATAAISPVDNKNTKSFKLQYRAANSGSTAWTTVNLPSTDYVLANHIQIVPGFDVDSAYEIQLVATDAFSERVRSFELPTAFTLMDFRAGGKGIAMGEVAVEDGLSVNLFSRFKKGIQVIVGRASNYFTFKKENGTTLAYINENSAGDGLVLNTTGGYVAFDSDGGVRTSGAWATVRRDLLLDQHINGSSNSIQTGKLTLPPGVSNVNYYDYVEVMFRHGDLGSMSPGYSIVSIWSYDTYWAASYDQTKPIDINISTGNWAGLRTQYSIPSGKHSQIQKIYGVKHCRANITLDEPMEGYYDNN